MKSIQRTSGFSISNSLAIKGIAIIMLLFHHLYRVPAIYKGFSVDFLFMEEAFATQLFTYFKVCVGVFAFISGYGIAKAYKKNSKFETTGSFAVKRYLKSMAPFWFVYIISLIVTEAINGRVTKTYFSEKENPILGIVYMLLDFLGLRSYTQTPQLDSSWWYLGIVVLIILTVPLFVKIIQKQGSLLLIASVIILPRLLGIEFQGGTAPFSFIMAVILGVVFEHYKLFEKINSFKIKFFNIRIVEHVLTFLFFLTLLLSSFWYYDMVKQKVLWEVSYGVVPVVLVIFLNKYVVEIPVLKNILIFFGKYSANMFFVHTLIREYIKRFLYEKPNFLISFLIFFGISLGVSIILEIIKKLIRFDFLISKALKCIDSKNNKIENPL